jgi:hypothetical protein
MCRMHGASERRVMLATLALQPHSLAALLCVDGTPLPAAVVSRGIGRLLCRQRPRRGNSSRMCLFREDEPGRQSVAKLLSKDEARRIAANIAKFAT